MLILLNAAFLKHPVLLGMPFAMLHNATAWKLQYMYMQIQVLFVDLWHTKTNLSTQNSNEETYIGLKIKALKQPFDFVMKSCYTACMGCWDGPVAIHAATSEGDFRALNCRLLRPSAFDLQFLQFHTCLLLLVAFLSEAQNLGRGIQEGCIFCWIALVCTFVKRSLDLGTMP